MYIDFKILLTLRGKTIVIILVGSETDIRLTEYRVYNITLKIIFTADMYTFRHFITVLIKFQSVLHSIIYS